MRRIDPEDFERFLTAHAGIHSEVGYLSGCLLRLMDVNRYSGLTLDRELDGVVTYYDLKLAAVRVRRTLVNTGHHDTKVLTFGPMFQDPGNYERLFTMYLAWSAYHDHDRG